MGDVLRLIVAFLRDFGRSRACLEAELSLLRQQLAVLKRKSARPQFNRLDRLIFALLYRLNPGIVDALHIVRPETVIRWHRMGFKALWRWKSRPRGGRPKVSKEIRGLIREMSLANPLWGAPRIHGERAMIGVDVAQSTVAKYMVGVKAEVARELAYRLYTLCERKKRASDALAYNALVQSWPEISRLAQGLAATVNAGPAQAAFDLQG